MRRYWVHNIEFYDEKSCDDCDTVVKLADVQAWLEEWRDEFAGAGAVTAQHAVLQLLADLARD